MWMAGVPLLVVELIRNKPDLLVLHGQWGAVLGAMAGRIARVRMVYIAHWPTFYGDWDAYRAMRNHLCELLPCRWCVRVITLCESSRYEYFRRDMVDYDKLVVLPNPVDLTTLPTPSDALAVRARHRWDPGQFHVVSVGRLAEQKRVDWLLRSWKIVQERAGGAARLWIVGDGDEEAKLKALARSLGVTETCVFLGAQPTGIAYVAAADLVVATSMFESFGYVVAEAQACGKAVVTNKVHGICDIMKDGVQGYLVNPGDFFSFADRIINLMQDAALRSRMGEAGRQAVLAYSREKVMAAYDRLFTCLLARTGNADTP